MTRRRPRLLREEVGYFDLLADLTHPGCPVCHGANRSAWNHIDSILWESVNDSGIRHRLRASHGFCREHLFMAARVARATASETGLATLLEDFLRHVRSEAEGMSDGPTEGRRRRRDTAALPPHAACPACETADQTARNYLHILAGADEDSEPGIAIRREERGMCVPHLALGLAAASGGEERARLVSQYASGDDELRHSLIEFVGKHDYLRHHEGFTDLEKRAWPRAVARLVGEPPPAREPPR